MPSLPADLTQVLKPEVQEGCIHLRFFAAGGECRMVNSRIADEHRLRNLAHTLLLIGGMALLLAVSAELILGHGLWPWVLGGVALFILLPDVSSHWVLQMYRARPVSPRTEPTLIALLEELSRRAGLERVPDLYWIPSRSFNAFAVGARDRSAVAVTAGLLERLSLRELAAVLAHEISHVANNDMRLLGLADLASRLTHVLSMTGLLLALVALPLMLLGYASISVFGLLLLIAAPHLSALLQMALSRIREFEADREAARITGDPRGLASALNKLEPQRRGLWQRILYPGYGDTGPSLLRSHPPTEERIDRLLELSEDAYRPIAYPRPLAADQLVILPSHYRVLGSAPHQRLFRGIWY